MYLEERIIVTGKQVLVVLEVIRHFILILLEHLQKDFASKQIVLFFILVVIMLVVMMLSLDKLVVLVVEILVVLNGRKDLLEEHS